ncbi:MAG: hypothetical protein ACREPS_07445 [Rhodanobacteraceae bacterium]
MSIPVKLVLNICDYFHLEGQIKNERVYIFESLINPLNGLFSLAHRRNAATRLLLGDSSLATSRIDVDRMARSRNARVNRAKAAHSVFRFAHLATLIQYSLRAWNLLVSLRCRRGVRRVVQQPWCSFSLLLYPDLVRPRGTTL